MGPGRLITIEGIDGAGKSTLAVALESALTERGIRVHVMREPGGVAAAERIRELVKDPSVRIAARAEALLYAAARAQLVEERVRPLLQAGSWVLLDRFVDSSLAYQGAGRGLAVGTVRAINDFATGGLAADRTLLLVIAPEVGRSRTVGRADELDRLEREHPQFFATIAHAYEELAAREPHRIRAIDASEPPERVLEAALAGIADLL